MKLGLTLSALLLILVPMAQGELIKGYGFKTGVVIANQEFDYTDPVLSLDTKNRVGFDIGGFFEWFNLPYFSVSTEAHYIQKGMMIEVMRYDEYDTPIGNMKFDYRVDYLSASALSKLTLKRKPISPYLLVGPRVDFLIGNHSEFSHELYDEFKSIDFGVDAGIGGEFSIGDLPVILLEFRYSHDLTKAFKSDLLQVNNKSYQILAGIRL